MAVKKVRERVHNGGTTGTENDWDTIYTETSEDVIVGQVQLLESTGFKVHPGGYTEQWGIVENVTNAWKTVRYPLEFKNKCVGIKLTEIADTGGAAQTFIQTSTATRVDLFAFKHESTTPRKFFWEAKGY